MPDHQNSFASSKLLDDHDRALSIRDASRLFGLPEHALRRYQSSGVVAFYKIGRSVFLSESSLRAVLARARVGSDRPSASDEIVPFSGRVTPCEGGGR